MPSPRKPADLSGLYQALKSARQPGKGKAKVLPNQETIDLIKRWVGDTPEGGTVKVYDIAQRLTGQYDGATILEALGYEKRKSWPTALVRNTLNILEAQGLVTEIDRNNYTRNVKKPAPNQ